MLIPPELPDFAAKQNPALSFSIHDLDEDPPSVFHAAGLDYRTQRLRRPAMAADHLPAVLLCDAQLEHERSVVFLELAHLDLVGTIDERLGEELEQLLQAIPFAFSRCLTASLGCAPWRSQ